MVVVLGRPKELTCKSFLLFVHEDADARQSPAEFRCAGKMLCKCRGAFRLVNKFSGIQNSVWIQRVFEAAMQLARHVAGRLGPPAFFGQADPMFACNDATPRKDLREEIVQSALDVFAHRGVAIVTVCHDVDVNVAVPSVTKAGDRKSVLNLKCLREFHEIDEMTPRHDHILVKLRQAARAQLIAKLTAQCPESFGIDLTDGYLQCIWFSLLEQLANSRGFAANTFLLSVNIDEQMRVTLGHKHFAQIPSRCFQREMIGDFQRRRQKSSRENRLHGFGGLPRNCKRSRQSRARRWKRKQTQRDLSHHAEHSFRADKQTYQVESRLVLVHATACSQHFATGQYHFEADYVISRYAVFQTTRPACVCGDISANSAILHARRVRRIE